MRALRVFVVTATCLFALAGTASAATTVGQTFPPAISTLPHTLNFATSVSTGLSNQVTAPGVITSFSHHAEASPDATLSLVVMRQTGADFTVVGVTGPQLLPNGILGSWPARIPVQTGDRIGVYGDTPALAAASPAAAGNNFVAATTGPLAAGAVVTAATLGPSYDGYLLDIAATVEADADADGYGDETQDQCPTSAATQAPCPDVTAPTLKLKYSKSLKKSKNPSVKVTADEAGTATISGTIKVNGKTYKFKSVKKTLSSTFKATLTAKLPKKAKAAIKQGNTGKAKLKVVGTDAADNSRTYKLSVKIKR